MYVRVAISQKFDEVLFQFPTRIIAKIMVENTTVVAFLVDFVGNPHLFSEVCGPHLTITVLGKYKGHPDMSEEDQSKHLHALQGVK